MIRLALGPNTLDGIENRCGFEQHAFTSAERAIVDGAMAVFGELAQILDIYIDQAGFAGTAEDAVVERADKKFGKDGDEVEAHEVPV